MRQIEEQGKFKRDYRRELKGRHGKELKDDVGAIVTVLASDGKLLPRHKDHPLSGTWDNFCGCHVKPDLVLIYRKVGEDRLHLVRLGSHAELKL